MEFVSILAVLRRHWLLLLPGLAVAAFVGLSALYHVSLSSPHLTSRRTVSGLAVGQSLLTTSAAPTFQLSDHAYVAQTLPARGQMLTNLMATDAKRSEIARRAGVDVRLLAVFGPSASTAMVPVPIATEATRAALEGSGPYRIVLAMSDSSPLITVQATAPDPVVAARLVGAARDTMSRVLTAHSGPDAQVGLEALGPSRSGLIVNEPSKALAPAAAMLVFAFWCTGVIVIMSALPRLRQRSAARLAAASS